MEIISDFRLRQSVAIIRHYARHERAYPGGWFLSTGITPLGEPYAHAVHGSVVRRSFRWLFVRRRAAAWILSQMEVRHSIRYHGSDWTEVQMARDYRAEYGRRIAKAEAEGRSRASGRGHASLADLRTTIASGRVAIIDPTPGPRLPNGRYAWLDITVTMANGRKMTYTLRGKKATTKELKKLARRLDRKGIHVNAIHYLIGQMAKEKTA